ncbi:glutamate receptor ionotropic, delta-1-like [Eriocheir sinensis]|uniref:glutamate receptor ionotropic, delta-1-like n=1 Tax=Eriocheir sinensis TaxID=95602 RepID=UPI0021CA75CF|nr:glutamate receptor ionotropic, delta-1-like [Eriocheir sinensis]
MILEIIADHIGRCFKYTRAPLPYGQSQPNGSWTGTLGLVQRNEFDFLASFITLSPERMAALDPSTYIILDEMTAVYVRPGVEPDVAGFVKPYTAGVWLLVLFTGLFVFAAGVIVLRCSGRPAPPSSTRDAPLAADVPRDAAADGSDAAEAEAAGWLAAARRASLWTWSTMLAHSVPWEPSSDRARVVLGLWLLAVFTLGSVYCSNLKAMLILPKINLPFDSLEQLGDTSIRTLVFQDSLIHRQIEDSDINSNLGRLRDQLVVMPVEQRGLAFAHLMSGRAAGISFYQGIIFGLHQDYSVNGKCNLYILSRGFLGPTALTLAFPKGSPHKAKFDRVIVGLRESGILGKLFFNGVSNASECTKPVSSSLANAEQRPLELADFYGVLSLYAAGMIMSFGAFAAEMMVRPGKRRRS